MTNPVRGSLSEKSASTIASRLVAPRKRILAIDYGRQRIGLALSDELHLTARPLGSIEHANRREVLRRLREICREQGVAKIIVGNPLQMDGATGKMSAEAARFAARVQKEVGVPVELVDERLTSWEAEETLRHAKRGARDRATTDEVAAAVILREYLDYSRKPVKD